MKNDKLESNEYNEKNHWFVHHFVPNVKHLASQILGIIKGDPDAKAMMEKKRNAGQ